MSDMIENFNYGEITEDQKKVAEEIKRLAEQRGDTMFAELLKYKFQLGEATTYNLDDSLFVNTASASGIYCNVQGFYLEPETNQRYQVISITEDVRKLNKFIADLMVK
jgi:hypothetical protein